MNPWLLALMAVVNAVVACGYFEANRFGMTVTFGSYATACIGFLVDFLEKA